ncbi:MAG: PocR ligand-binding domain-containing protein [Desulfobacteraceae bacterium]|nr:PocR ligand-binding domain-containing protein [Desulfobacteraceae bacterium]
MEKIIPEEIKRVRQMKLDDILSIEKWTELEKEINNTFGVCASVFDTDSKKITKFTKWPNRLCPIIQADGKSQSFICAVANLNLGMQARQTKKPVIAECDAGLLKLVVPVFVDDEFLGMLSGCGILLDDSSVETYLITKFTGIDEEEIASLSNDINKMERVEVELLAKYLETRVEGIVEDFINN